MALPIITWGDKRLGENEKALSGGGGLDLCQGYPRIDPVHGGRYSHPPIEEAEGAPHPGGYPYHTAKDGPKGPRTPSC